MPARRAPARACVRRGRIVGVAQIEKTRRARLADERRVLHEAEVVGHHHQLAGAHGFVQAAGGVGLHQGLHAGRGQRVDRAFIAATSPPS